MIYRRSFRDQVVKPRLLWPPRPEALWHTGAKRFAGARTRRGFQRRLRGILLLAAGGGVLLAVAIDPFHDLAVRPYSSGLAR